MRLKKGVSKFLAGESRLNGCLLFLDISGFTKLTENYMRGEYSGAEKVSDMLNSIFKPIVGIISGHGGAVAVFAGDAVSSVFPSSRRRDAIECACEIMKAADGKILPEIRIKLAVLDGEITVKKFKSRGKEHLLFDGKPFRDLKKAQKHLASGEILLTETLFKAAGKMVAGSGRLAGGLIRTLPNPQKTKAKESKKRNPFLKISSGKKQSAEFRRVASLFIDFSKTGRSSDRFVCLLIEACGKYSAEINMLDSGDKGRVAFVILGAPKSFEDDVKRGAMLISDLNSKFPGKLRAGMTYGMAFAGTIGGRERSTYTAIGDNVNAAARMMSRAGSGETLVSEDIFRELSESFSFNYAGTMDLKGKENSIHTYYLAERLERAEKKYETKFVGRGKYLEAGRKIIGKLSEGMNAGVIAITGEAGIGKSRLVNELLRELKGDCDVFYLYSDDIGKRSLFPFIKFGREFFGYDDAFEPNENAAGFSKVMESLFPLQKSSLMEREREIDYILKGFLGMESSDRWRSLDAKSRNDLAESALVELFRAVAKRNRTVFVFDDYHGADIESARLAGRIVHNLVNEPCLFVFSSRPLSEENQIRIPHEESSGFMEISLGQFDSAEMQDFLRDRFLYEPDKKLSEYITDKSSGNPFYAEQIALYLIENGYVNDLDGVSSLAKNISGVPTTVYSLVIARIDKLKESLRDAVKRASVIGNEFEAKILSAMMKSAKNADRIREGEQSGIWSPLNEMRYIFRHSIIRDAAYEMQLKRELQQLHGLAASAIESVYKSDRSKFYEIAVHYDKAGKTEKAKECYNSAADFAVENFKNSEAMRIYERLIELSEDFKEKFKNIIGLTNTLELTSNWRRGVDVLADAIERHSEEMSAVERGEIKLKLSYLKLKMGEIKSVMPDFEEAERIFRNEGHLINHLITHNFMGIAYTRLGEFEKSAEKFDELINEAESYGKRKDIKRIVGEAMVNKGFTFQELEKFDDSLDCYDRAVEIAEETEDRRLMAQALVNKGNILFFKRDLDGAREIYLRQLELDRELGDKYMERVILNNLGAIESIKYNYDKAIDYTKKSYEISKYINEKRGERMALGNLGSCYAIIGDFEEAEKSLLEGLKISRELKDLKGIAVILDTLSKLYLEEEKVNEAMVAAEEALKITEDSKLKSLYLSVSITAAQIMMIEGEDAKAAALAESAFGKASAERDMDDHARLFIVRERIRSKSDKDAAAKNLENYLNAAKSKGPKGMLLMELYFLNGDGDIKRKALEILSEAYAETSDVQYKRYREYIEKDFRDFTL